MAFSSHGILGPYFFEDDLGQTQTVTTERYLTILKKFISILSKKRGVDFEIQWFMQDGAPAHRSIASRNWLSDKFQNRVISIKTDFEWAPYLPDFNPLDFFVWCYLKGRVYSLN